MDAGACKSKWTAASQHVDSLNKTLASLPFLEGWAKHNRKLKDKYKTLGLSLQRSASGAQEDGTDEGGSGWDAIFEQTGGASYVKGGMDHQGASECLFGGLEMMEG